MLRPTDVRVLAAVAFGGAIGALGRYGVEESIGWDGRGFPWATFLVNISGCLIVGALVVLVVEHPSAHPLARPFLITGLLGGYTTFSTFAVEWRELSANGQALAASSYVVASLVVGIAAVALMRSIASSLRRQHNRDAA